MNFDGGIPARGLASFMRTDVQGSTSGPEALFAGLMQPSPGHVPKIPGPEGLRGSVVFFLAMLGFTVLLTLGQVRAAGNGAFADLLPSETVFALLIGAAVFPLRWIAVPVGTFVLCYTVSFGLRQWLETDYVPDGVPASAVFWGGMILNALPGLAAGLAGRAAVLRFARGRADGDMLVSGVGTLVYVLLACATVLIVTRVMAGAGWPLHDYGLLSAAGAGMIRAARIGISGAVLLLFLLDQARGRRVRLALVVLPLFVGLGVLRVMGYAVHPTLDVELLALGVALLAPATVAVLANILGVVAYVTITGEFLVQITVPSIEVMRLEVASVLLLGLVYLLLLQRHRMAAERVMNRATIERMARVQALATIGYFVLDIQTRRVRVDGIAAEILGTERELVMDRFLRRVRPEDRETILRAIADGTTPTRTLSFLVGRGEVWSYEGDARYLAVHAWYEDRGKGQRLAYGTLIDLTQDHLREKELAAALASLSDQQDRQTQMFSIVSHELRTPASVISMLIEEMENGASWAEMGPRMRAVSDQLLSVLGDMRQTVRPEQNLPVRMESLQPQDLAATVRNTFAIMADARGIEIDLDLSPVAWQRRVSDRVRLMQALSNLVKNAILHAECHRISIGYAEEIGTGGGIVGIWRVSDDGRGIPEEARATLFEAFRRGGGKATARADGSGLGLYVTKSSIELLGGTVSHQPRGAGGSVFLLRVPMDLADESEGDAAPTPNIDLAVLRDLSVLIAEDSDLIGELLVARLKRIFGRVIWVKDGAQALSIFDREAPDIVLSDLFMPEMGGDDLTAALRAQGADCPIIGMTAAAIGDERERFEAAGTDCVLTKPVSTAQLIEEIEKISSIRRFLPPAAE